MGRGQTIWRKGPSRVRILPSSTRHDKSTQPRVIVRSRVHESVVSEFAVVVNGQMPC
jgi:hypothetical protein